MGTVYEAVDVNNGRRVAIKMNMPYLDNGEITARFEREAMIMSELNHPNIVRLYDWDKENERVYIVMEYLDGPTLENVISTNGKLSLELAVAIFEPIVQAIGYTHQKGFVRHDIKPSNVKITSSGRVCILDFGTTRPAGDNPTILSKFQTMSGGIIGTPMFMAPEQLLNAQADERSDIYSLGINLYYMVTGKFPFGYTRSFHELVELQGKDLPMPPSQHVVLPTSVQDLILKCLQKDPKKRFQSTEELLDALNEATRDVPQIYLKLAIDELGQKARKIAAMDEMVTAAPVDSFVLPMSTRVPAPRPVPLSKSGTEFEREPKPDVTIKRAATPRIRLSAGTAEDVDFHLSGSESGFRLENKTTFGRSSENVIVMRNEKVSRYHGQFLEEAEQWFVEDFNSNRGTYVNGDRILARRILETGDEIAIGDFVLIFEQ